MHGLVHGPAKQGETLVPVPGFAMIATDHRFDTMVDLTLQFPHAGSIGHQDTSIFKRDQIRVNLAVLEIHLVICPCFPLIGRPRGRDPSPVIAKRRKVRWLSGAKRNDQGPVPGPRDGSLGSLPLRWQPGDFLKCLHSDKVPPNSRIRQVSDFF